MVDPYDVVFSEWLKEMQARPDATTVKRPPLPGKPRTIGPQSAKSSLPAVQQPSTTQKMVEGIASVLPGSGEGMAAAETLKNATAGKMGSAAVSALGMLPVVGAMKKVGKAAKVAKAIDATPSQVLRAQTLPATPKAVLDYGFSHRPPGPDSGAPLHDLTGGGNVYPDDVYSHNAVQYYGTGYPALDKQTLALAHSIKGRPDAQVTIYRAVPNHIDAADIRDGDWVTINPAYAKQHGESTLRGNYKIIAKQVRAADIFTNGDSIHEFGYWPTRKAKP